MTEMTGDSSRPEPEKPTAAWDFRDAVYPAKPVTLPGYRPGGLTAVCILAIILGALGFLAGISSLVMSVVGNQAQQWQQQWGMAGSPPAMRDVQAEMNAKTMAIVDRFRLVNIAFALFQLAVTAALVVGGARALKLNEAGRKLLWAACAVAMVFELGRAVPQVLMQLENMAVMEDYMPRLMEASAPGPQAKQVAAFGAMIARFSVIMGWVVFAGWLILKLAFFGVAFYYLGRPKTKAFYTS